MSRSRKLNATEALSTFSADDKKAGSYCFPLVAVFAVVLTVWVTLGLVAFYYASRDRKQQQGQVFCCPDVLTDLETFVNPNLDPCDNFYEYTCRRSVDDSLFGGLNNVFDDVRRRVLKNISNNVFANKVKSKAMVALATFHLSCLNPMVDTQEAGNQMIQALGWFHGRWGVLSAMPSDEDIVFLTMILSLNYRAPSVVSFMVVSEGFSNATSPTSSRRPSIDIRPGRSLANKFSDHQDIENYTISTMLGWINRYVQTLSSQSVLVSVENVLAVERDLALDSYTWTATNKITTSQLSQLWPPLKAFTIINMISRSLPKSIKYSHLESIYTASLDYISSLTRRLLKPEYRHVIQPLLLIHAFVPMVPELFLFNFRHEDRSRAIDACGTVSQKVNAIWEMATYETLENPKVNTDVTKMFLNVRSALAASVNGTSDMEESSRQEAVAKVTKARIVFPNDTLYHSVEIPLMGNNFFVNIMGLLQYHEETTVKHAIDSKYDWSLTAVKNSFTYFGIYNAISITLYGMQRPLYYSNAEDFINYATLGVHLASALFEAIGFSGSRLDSNEERRDWWTEKTLSAMEAEKKCYVAHYVHPGKASAVEFEAYYDTVIAVARSLELVWNMMADKLTDRTIVQRPKWNLTRKQLFLIRFCQSWCRYWTSPTPDAWLCNIPLQRLRAFELAFGCLPGQNMTGGKSCNMIIPE
ncbi:endothelin-converting enzyme 2-like [Ornithodoros turicata]|uniref:endothelin-converting enzyme 2-like n=1 Tax=Ornithodoros turicata TaxID=34597 RepID=UPI003139147E